MTLMEVLLTLCLLVILASLTWPSLGRPMATQRLREAADQVRLEWVRSRVQAMSTGRTYVFRYTADSDTYSIEFQTSDDDRSNTTALGVGEAPGEGSDAAAPRASQQRRLPEKVRFVIDQTSIDPAATTATSPATTPADAGTVLSDPIVFRPDGTSSSVRVRLENQYQQSIELTMRGLTGVVTLGGVQSGEARTP